MSASATENLGPTSGAESILASKEVLPALASAGEGGSGGKGISFARSNEELSSAKNGYWNVLYVLNRNSDLGDCEGDGPVLGTLENDPNCGEGCDIMGLEGLEGLVDEDRDLG